MMNEEFGLRSSACGFSGVSQANKTNSHSSFFILHSSFQKAYATDSTGNAARHVRSDTDNDGILRTASRHYRCVCSHGFR